MAEPCPYCGGDESKCDFDFETDACSEMDRLFEIDKDAAREESRIVGCETCGTEGRDLRGDGPDPKDYGPCSVCDGTGGEIIHTEPINMEDLDAAHCGAH